MEKKLPKDWRVARFGEVLKRKTMQVSPSNYPAKEFFYVGLEHIESNTGQLKKANYEYGKNILSNKNSFESDDILYGKLRPYLNKVWLADRSGVCSTDIWVLQSNKAVADSRFVSAFLKLPRIVKILNAATEGINLPRVNVRKFDKISIPLPPLSIQRRIVEILEEADSLRKLRRQADEKMQNLLPSLFVQMFGDPATNPKGWRMVRLGEVCEINPSKPTLSADSQVTFLSMSAINDKGEIVERQAKAYEEVQKGYTGFIENDVLFAKITPCMENGKGAIAKNLINAVGFGSTEFHVIRASKEILPDLIFRYLSLKHIRRFAASHMTGSAGQKRVPESFLNKLQIPLPPIPRQQEFAARVEEIEAEKARQAESRKKLDELFNSLMQRAFSGELVA